MTSAEEVIELAKTTTALSEDQVQDIIELAPRMSQEDLSQLKVLIFRLAKQTVKVMEVEFVLWKHLAEHHRVERREKQKELEAKEHSQEQASADALIDNL